MPVALLLLPGCARPPSERIQNFENMRRGSFRPRPIQNKKPLPILQTGVLEFTDESGSKTVIPQFSHLIDDPNAAGVQKSTTLIDIPTPIVHTVQDYKHEVRGGYSPPDYFIRNEPVFYSNEPDLHDVHKMDYSLDSQDMQFLSSHQLYGENGDPRYRIEPAIFEKIIYLLEFECDKQNKVISEKEAEDVLVKYLGLVRSNQCTVCRDMYRYWVAKRTRNQKPLLRRFWPITQPTDPDPHMVFRPRDEQGMKNRLRRSRKDDKSSYDKLKLIQQDLEQVTRMLKCLRKRELFKASKLKYEEQLFLQSIFDKINAKDSKREPKILKERQRLLLEGREGLNILTRPSSSLSDGGRSIRSADGVGSPRSTGDLTPKVSNTSVHTKRRSRNPLTSVQMRKIMEAAGKKGAEEIMSVVQASPRRFPSAAVHGISSVLKSPSSMSRLYPMASLRRPSINIPSQSFQYDENSKIGLRPEDKKPEDALGDDYGPPFVPSYMHHPSYLTNNSKFDAVPRTEPSIPTYSIESDFDNFISDETKSKPRSCRGRVGRHGRIWIDQVLSNAAETKTSVNNRGEDAVWADTNVSCFDDILLRMEDRLDTNDRFRHDRTQTCSKRKAIQPDFYAPPHPLASGSKFVDTAKPLSDQMHSVSLEPLLSQTYQIKDNLEKIYYESDEEDDDFIEYGGDNEKPLRSLNFALHM